MKTKMCSFVAIAVVVFMLVSMFACKGLGSATKTVFKNFITREGDKLMDGSQEFRFISFDMPELSMQESPYWGIIDPFEQEDAIKTIAQMGGQVTRPYVFSILTTGKNIAHIEGIGKYNEECFQAFDNLLSLCNQYGVRLIIPFIDTWQWWGGIPEFCALRGKDKSEFWTDAQLKQDYKDFISYVLNRTNTVTGVAYKDDPAILAWETGNELRQSTYAWTKEMAEYIKSIDQNHLLMDGRDEQHFDESIEDPNIDIITAHYYGGNFVEQFQNDYARVEGKKPFIVGEFGLVDYDEIKALVNEIVKSGASGGMIWSLRQHDANGGFLWHNEGGTPYYAYHWPGFEDGASYNEQAIVGLIWEAAYRIQGKELPLIPAPDSAPILLPIQSVSDIRWLGVVGASGYNIERKEGENGEWMVIAENVSDSVFDSNFILKRRMLDKSTGVQENMEYRILFQDHGAEAGKTYYYRVQAVNSSGVSEYSNEEKIENAQVEYGILIDKLNDFSKMFEHSQELGFDSEYAGFYEWDTSRLKREADSAEYVVYQTPLDMNSFQIFAYSLDEEAEFNLSVSIDGKDFSPIDATRFTQMMEKGNYYKIVYFTEKLPPSARYLKIEFGDSTAPFEKTQISIVKMGYGSMQLIPLEVPKIAEFEGPYIIDDFKTYTSPVNDSYTPNPGGGTFQLSLDTVNKESGEYGLKYEYDTGTPGYAGGTKSLGEGSNWTGNEEIILWFYPDGSGNRLVLQFREKSGEYWEYSHTIIGNTPEVVQILLSDFAQPPWGGKVDGKLDLSTIVEFSIYVNKNTDSTGSTGTLYFDDIKVVPLAQE